MGAKPDRICSLCSKPRFESDVTKFGGNKCICGPCARRFFKNMYRTLEQLGFVIEEGCHAVRKGRDADSVKSAEGDDGDSVSAKADVESDCNSEADAE